MRLVLRFVILLVCLNLSIIWAGESLIYRYWGEFVPARWQNFLLTHDLLLPPKASYKKWHTDIVRNRNKTVEWNANRCEIVLYPEHAFESTQLLLSNNPEAITSPGVVDRYSGLRGAKSLLLYHRNISDVSLNIEVLINTEQPAVLYQRLYQAGPDYDMMFVGKRLAQSYLQFRHAGEVVPFNSEIVIFRAVMKPQQCATALLELDVDTNRDYSLRVQVSALGSVPKMLLPELDKDVIHPYGTFALTPVEKVVALTNSNRIYTLSIGDEPYEENRRGFFEGQYMVLHHFTLKLGDQIQPNQNWAIYFVPRAGAALSVFWINQTIYATGHHEMMVYRFRSEDYQRRKIEIETVPLVGSNYPVSLVIRRSKGEGL